MPHSVAFGMPLRELLQSPHTISVVDDSEAEVGNTVLEPMCSHTVVPGAFVHRDVCRGDPSCTSMLPPCDINDSSFFWGSINYIWKPHGCRLPIFATAQSFLKAHNISLESDSNTGRKYRIMLVGDSLQREFFAAIRQFFQSDNFADVVCPGRSRILFGRPKTGLSASYLEIKGFFNRNYGWRDYPSRTKEMIELVQAKARRVNPDLIIWNDAGHSLEKNDAESVVQTVVRTARKFKTEFGSHRIVFMLANYVHAIGVTGNAIGNGFYSSSHLLQPSRVANLNDKVRPMLEELGIHTVDPSVVHAARPEASKDKMHWGRSHSGHDITSDPPARCSDYCSGKWVYEGVGVLGRERDVPFLLYSSLQLLLATVSLQIHHQDSFANHSQAIFMTELSSS